MRSVSPKAWQRLANRGITRRRDTNSRHGVIQRQAASTPDRRDEQIRRMDAGDAPADEPHITAAIRSQEADRETRAVKVITWRRR